jgi:protein TonB
MLGNPAEPTALRRLVFPAFLALSLALHLALLLYAFDQETVPPQVRVTIGLSSISTRPASETTTAASEKEVSPPLKQEKPDPAPRTAPSPKEPALKPAEPDPLPKAEPDPLPQAEVEPAPVPEAPQVRDTPPPTRVAPPPDVPPAERLKLPRLDKPETVRKSAEDAPASAASAPSAGAITVDLLPSKLRGNPAPIYPPEALRNRIEGRVVLRALISATGTVQSLTVHRSSNVPLLDEAALTAVRAWRFQPGLRAGKAVPCEVAIPIVFEMADR